ncbi:hypothetical protein BDW75DRAFT_169295 [Aspergillus navahoensis]
MVATHSQLMPIGLLFLARSPLPHIMLLFFPGTQEKSKLETRLILGPLRRPAIVGKWHARCPNFFCGFHPLFFGANQKCSKESSHACAGLIIFNGRDALSTF